MSINDGAPSFVIPEDLDATCLVLSIEVSSSGKSRRFRAALSPGEIPFEPMGSDVEALFQAAGVMPRPGAYVFECTLGGCICTMAPLGISNGDLQKFTMYVRNAMYQYLEHLMEACSTFPSTKTIERLGQQVVGWVFSKSLEGTQSKVVRVADPQDLPMEPFECTVCGPVELGQREAAGNVLGISFLEVREMDGIVFVPRSAGNQFSLDLGYLKHRNPFSLFFNGLLVQHLREAIVRIMPNLLTDLFAQLQDGIVQKQAEIVQAQADILRMQAIMASLRCSFDPMDIPIQEPAQEGQSPQTFSPDVGNEDPHADPTLSVDGIDEPVEPDVDFDVDGTDEDGYEEVDIPF